MGKVWFGRQFRHCVFPLSEEYGKPHPGVYLTVSGRLGVNPEYCLVFEDSMNGVVAAKAAKMTSFLGAFLIALFTAGAGFVLYELAQKVAAESFGVSAGFKAFDNMLFLAVLIATDGIFHVLGLYGFIINSRFALFNLIPFGGFYGGKVFSWSKPAYFTLVLLAIISLGVGIRGWI